MLRLFKTWKSQYVLLGLFVLTVVGFTAASLDVQTIGFYRAPVYSSTAGGQAGGRVVFARTGTDSLRVGQVVYWSDTNTVATSSTLAAYNAIAGVVVGGSATAMQALNELTDTSTLATTATSTSTVIVLTQGRTWVLNDANGAIAVGNRIIPSNATAGRSEIVTSAIDTNYRVIGKAVVPAAAGKATLTDVNIR